MKSRQSGSVLALLLCLLAAHASAAEPPKIPGKIYVQTADGCGMMFAEDPSFTPEILGYFKEEYWLGECTHGLANGLGYIYRPSHVLGFVQMAYMKFGEQVLSLRASVSPASGQLSSINFGPEYTYSLTTEDGGSVSYASVPVDWDIRQPHTLPLFAETPPAAGNFNIASVIGIFGGAAKQEPALGGSRFSLVEGLASGVPKRSVDVRIEKRRCLLADKKIRGCHYSYDEFDVFGVVVDVAAGGKRQASFTLCPVPKTLTGCGPAWRKATSAHLGSISALVVQGKSVMAADQAAPAGWAIGGMVRKPPQIRFQTLIVPIATVMLAISPSVKCTFSASKASSGAPVPAMFVTASTQPSRARSRCV